MTTSTGSVAAAVASRNRKRLIQAFFKADATSPERAKTLAELDLTNSVILQVQLRRGVLVQIEGDKYYLDPIREQDVARKRRITVISFLFIIVLAAWLFNWF